MCQLSLPNFFFCLVRSLLFFIYFKEKLLVWLLVLLPLSVHFVFMHIHSCWIPPWWWWWPVFLSAGSTLTHSPTSTWPPSLAGGIHTIPWPSSSPARHLSRCSLSVPVLLEHFFPYLPVCLLIKSDVMCIPVFLFFFI